MLLKNKMESGIKEFGMEIPFQKEIESNHKVAVAKHIHSEKCRRNRKSRNEKFNKVRVLYWNLMFLLSGIVIVSIGRILYDVIRILKMQ